MAWLAVNENGQEVIMEGYPSRGYSHHELGDDEWYNGVWCADKIIEIPKGTIESIIGEQLSWEDKPVELKIN
ncbi:MAG: fructan hydrolase [Clostridia bacterium]